MPTTMPTRIIRIAANSVKNIFLTLSLFRNFSVDLPYKGL